MLAENFQVWCCFLLSQLISLGKPKQAKACYSKLYLVLAFQVECVERDTEKFLSIMFYDISRALFIYIKEKCKSENFKFTAWKQFCIWDHFIDEVQS